MPASPLSTCPPQPAVGAFERRPPSSSIDIDFAPTGAREVIQHVYTRYGQSHAAMVCNVTTLPQRGPRSAFCFPQPVIDRLAREEIAGGIDPRAARPSPAPTGRAGGQFEGCPATFDPRGWMIIGPPLDEVVASSGRRCPGG
jgi:hypothetical protein